MAIAGGAGRVLAPGLAGALFPQTPELTVRPMAETLALALEQCLEVVRRAAERHRAAVLAQCLEAGRRAVEPHQVVALAPCPKTALPAPVPWAGAAAGRQAWEAARTSRHRGSPAIPPASASGQGAEQDRLARPRPDQALVQSWAAGGAAQKWRRAVPARCLPYRGGSP